MKEILRITIRLTLSCLVAAFFMGAVFTVTDKAKKHNEHQNVQNTMLSLLGYGRANPAPADLKTATLYRYIVDDGANKYLGYMVPVKKDGAESYEFLIIDLKGNFVERFPLDLPPEAAAEAPTRKAALKTVLKPPRTFVYADSAIFAGLGGRRLAYLLPGKFPGFKTFIHAMLALDPSFEIIGLEIMEHEEDPGLGGEIEQDYFKNQFENKSFDKLKEIKVVKEPLHLEYMHYLEALSDPDGAISRKDIEKIRSKYQDSDIYAITGATISSRAVTSGVKNIAKKFAYRLQILDRVIDDQELNAVF